MTPEERKLMDELCRQINVEKNDKTFMKLVQELNDLLEERDPNKFTQLCHNLNEVLEKKEG